MKKIFVLLLVSIIAVALAITIAVAFSDKEQETNINFPFEPSDITTIEMYHYTVPASAEKKVIMNQTDIETLYNTFSKLPVSTKDVEETTGGETTSFRFNLLDGTSYELIYIGYGVKNGVLTSPTAGFSYFTSANIGWNWDYLNEDSDAVSAKESELPKLME